MSVNSAGMAASVVSAYIQCLELPMPPILFQYNPEKFTITTQAHWKPGTPQAGSTTATAPQFLGTSAGTLTIPILLDAFAVPPVPPTATIEMLKVLLKPTPQSLMMRYGAGPKVMFGWGTNIIMEQAVVKAVAVDYERFLLGEPVRATARVTLEEVQSILMGTNPTSGGLATRRTRTVGEGDTLASIAYEEYKDPNKWRALAEANNIDDPMRVKPGQVLDVPDRRDAEALS
jgi:nucleoid-associated protein YgaU